MKTFVIEETKQIIMQVTVEAEDAQDALRKFRTTKDRYVIEMSEDSHVTITPVKKKEDI